MNSESFRYGFLSRCAQNGLSAQEALSLAGRHLRHLDEIEKQAGPEAAAGLAAGATYLGGKGLGYLESLGGRGIGYAERLIPWLAGIGLPAVALAGPATGALAGYGLGSLHGIEGESEDERRKRELARTYQLGAQQLSSR